MEYEGTNNDYDQSSSDDEGDLFKTEPTELRKSISYGLGKKEHVHNYLNDNNAKINNIPYATKTSFLNLQQNKSITSASTNSRDANSDILRIGKLKTDLNKKLQNSKTSTNNNLNNALQATINNIDIACKQHICLLCHANLSNIAKAKIHIEQHPVEELFLRKNKPFAKLIELTLTMMTTGVYYQCQLCGATLRDINSVMSHYSNHLGDFDIFIDSSMNRRFQALQPILDTMPSINSTSNTGPKYVKGDYDHPCMFCDGFYQSGTRLFDHLMNCYSQKVCGNRFTNLNSILVQEMDKVCEICSMPVKNYENHLRTHMKSKCDRCGKVFAKKSALEKHLTTHRFKKHTCPFCEEKFTTKVQLRKHIKTHPRYFNCRFCKQWFSKEIALIKHYKFCQKRHTQ